VPPATELVHVFAASLASIPSPPSNAIGPFRAYGLMIALGVLAAVEISRKRWRDKGGDADDISAIAIWAVPAGLVGARLWHVITDNQLFRDEPVKVFFIWEGGLGIPGGIILGISVGAWVGYRRGMRLSVATDAVIPTIALAQAIGRLGNWFNQELFGRPTDLPWGLEIDPRFRPAEYASSPTFHPTFLYEALWNIGLFTVLVLLDKRKVLRPGRILPLYLLGYGLGRIWVEAMRSDTANTILGLRVNTWTSLGLIATGLVWLAVGGVRRRPDDDDSPYDLERVPDRAVTGDEVDEDEAPPPGSTTTDDGDTAARPERLEPPGAT
jgi:prolipoprotein diacylglyceryl transferase